MQRSQQFREEDDAVFALSALSKPLAIAVTIILAVVVVIVIATLVPDYASSVGNATEAVTTADWGNAVVNNIASPFGMLMSLAGLFGIVGLVIGAIALNKGK